MMEKHGYIYESNNLKQFKNILLNNKKDNFLKINCLKKTENYDKENVIKKLVLYLEGDM